MCAKVARFQDPDDPFVVAIFQGPTPYYTPLLNALSDRVRLHVVYMSRGARPGMGRAMWTDFHDSWGEPPRFEHSFYHSRSIGVRRLDFQARVAMGVSRDLNRLNPDVVLAHSWGPLMIEPLLWSRLARRRAVMWTESTATSGLLRDPVTGFVRRRVVALADAFLSTGGQAGRFIEDLGADPERVVRSCLPSALAEAIAAAPSRRTQTVESGTRFLFVGRLVELKRPLQLAQAFVRALPWLSGASLTFVGDGPLREQLAEIAAASDGRVRLHERAEGQALAASYGDADVLVLPSVREVWGLVVNEALAAGLFVVATDQVGSAADLLDENSGLIIRADDAGQLEAALVEANRVGRSATDRAARTARINRCTREAFAADLRRAIGIAVTA